MTLAMLNLVRRRFALLRKEGGFTLVEIVIAISLLSILITLFAMMLSTTVARSSTIAEQATLESQGRAVVDVLAADLKQATCSGSTAPIVTASGTALTFYSPDRLSPYHLREIFYQLSGGVLTRRVSFSQFTGGPTTTTWGTMSAGTPVTALSSVANAAIFDFSDNSSPTPVDLSPGGAAVTAANLDNIAEADVSLVLSPTGGRGTGNVTVQAQISLRTPLCTN
jgi:prepilin-type N-terminal cleavage/methylation domain-containing protein